MGRGLIKSTMHKILFKEVQLARQNLLWSFLLVLPIVVFTVALVYQSVTGEMAGDLPMSNRSLAVLIVLILPIVAWAFTAVKLTTIIDEEKISYGWNLPTAHLNEIRFEEIAQCYVIRYKFVGYGYRISRLYGTVHNLRGNTGLQIVTRSGEKILIGTNKEAELKAAINKILIRDHS